MPTPDRTTLKAAVDELVSKLRINLVAEPPTATRPFRRVEVGAAGVEEYPRPFLTVALTHSKPVSTVQNDKLWQVTMSLRLVMDVAAADPHGTVLNAIGAVEDYLDSIVDTGVLDGAEGFDDRVWSFEYPRDSAGFRVAVASAAQSFVVAVQRQQNRVPAT